MCAFTPLKGVSDVVLSFLPGGKMPESEGIRDSAWGTRKWAVQATWDDVPHLDASTREELAKSYLPHERAARTLGVPQLGSGAIYPVPESDIVCEPFRVPIHWRMVYGLDVGWQRTAAIWLAIDDDNDVAYVVDEYYRAEAEPAVHAQEIRSRGDWIPGVIDPAARGRDQKDGTRLVRVYQELGLRLSLADNRVSGERGGIAEVWGRLSSGRLRVFRSCQNWLMEFRIYRRDEKGKIVKQNDHAMDATRYAIMSGMGIAALRPRTQPTQKVLFGDPHEIWRRYRAKQSAAQDSYNPFEECYANLPQQPNSPWRG
jgi:hypothetical protein